MTTLTSDESGQVGDGGGDDDPGDDTLTTAGGGRAEVEGAVPPDTGRRQPLVILAVLAVLCVPLAVAVAVLHGPRRYPLLDLAQTELRVRDVGGSHTPLVGLAGRIQAYGQQGSHPGPLSFLALWPIYKVFGSSSWALQVASVALHALAMGGILAVAHRRGGVRLTLAFGAVLAVLLHGYGTGVFVEPWNPYMPVLWWLLFLLAVWSVLCGDLPMLPVAVFAGSFCMQTHISYLGLVGGIAALTVLAVAAWAIPHGDHRPGLRRLLAWTGGSAALGLLLWVPPMIDQATNDPGNASMIVENFRHSSDDPIGLSRGVELIAVHLNLWRLLTGELATSGSVIPAGLLLAAWAAAVVVAWRLRDQALLRLHAVAGAALVLGVISASQILGELWYYLALWAWGIASLLVVATVWTFAAAYARRDQAGETGEPRRRRRRRPGRAGRRRSAWPHSSSSAWCGPPCSPTTPPTPRSRPPGSRSSSARSCRRRSPPSTTTWPAPAAATATTSSPGPTRWPSAPRGSASCSSSSARASTSASPRPTAPARSSTGSWASTRPPPRSTSSSGRPASTPPGASPVRWRWRRPTSAPRPTSSATRS